jgi:hypothetical protein
MATDKNTPILFNAFNHIVPFKHKNKYFFLNEVTTSNKLSKFETKVVVFELIIPKDSKVKKYYMLKDFFDRSEINKLENNYNKYGIRLRNESVNSM